MDNNTLTAIAGVEVGHWTDEAAATGVTVISFPEPNRAVAEVRGAAPGTRETALLTPGMSVETVQAIVLAGGSAFGLAAADGVMTELAAEGRGYPTPAGPVPIVPAAILFDLIVGEPVAPDAPAGAAAYLARSDAPVASGSIGAGTGATVSKWRGFEFIRKAGVGSGAAHQGDIIVAALVAVNAIGDVIDLAGRWITGDPYSGADDDSAEAAGERQNTTLVTIATNAHVSKADLQRFCVRGHDALGATLRPAHTRYDGDIVFAVSCGDEPGDLDVIEQAAFTVVADAVVDAVVSATTVAGIPAVDRG